MDHTAIIVLTGITATLTTLLVFAAGWCAARRGVTPAPPIRFPHRDTGTDASAAVRITVADLRERMRRLEAIASGIDL